MQLQQNEKYFDYSGGHLRLLVTCSLRNCSRLHTLMHGCQKHCDFNENHDRTFAGVTYWYYSMIPPLHRSKPFIHVVRGRKYLQREKATETTIKAIRFSIQATKMTSRFTSTMNKRSEACLIRTRRRWNFILRKCVSLPELLHKHCGFLVARGDTD